jgi:ankyrin repeat protein
MQSQLCDADSLWNKALQQLPDSERASLNLSNSNKPQILEHILVLTEAKKEVCLQKRWRYKKDGEVIFIRDKLEKITAWVQRFKDIGSAIVQYDPAHAALPWAGVLIILQIATNDSQTFGAMVDGIERVTNLISKYSYLEGIHANTQSLSTTARSQLQLALIKLYTSILRYLVKARVYFSKNTPVRVFTSALKTPDMEVQLYLDIASKKAADVDSCLLVIQSEFSQGHDKHLKDVLRLQAELQKPILRTSSQVAELHKQLSGQDRLRILTWLAKSNVHLHHRIEGEKYLPGSGSWLSRKPAFLQWQKSSTSAMLWLHGIPGCGKTMLIYNTVRTILDQNHNTANPAPVAFFYCSRNPAEPHRSNSNEVLRSLLKQLSIDSQGNLKDPIVRAFRERDKEAEACGEQATPLNISDAKSLIMELLEREPATIIIDALDECDANTRHKLLSTLHDIVKSSSNVVKILVSSRDDRDLCNTLSGYTSIHIHADDNGPDIENYVDHSLSVALKSGRLLNGEMSDRSRQEVSNTLKTKAQGMFRWVTMQIDNFCDVRRIKIEGDVLHELGQLPQTLRESYHSNYQRVLDLSRPSRIIAERIFRWLLCAQKMLNIEELAAAVTFPTESHVLHADTVVDICCNMVLIGHDGNFRFSHLSVREYLEGLDTYSASQCHFTVLERCLASYLNTAVDWTLHNALDLAIKPYAMLHWVTHCQDAGTPATDESLALLVKAFVFGANIEQNTTDAFADWVTDIWSASQYPEDWDSDSLTLQKLECAASSPPNPQFLACTFDMVWILDAMASTGWKEWNTSNNKSLLCSNLTARWGNLHALTWLLDGDCVTPEAMTDALSVAIESTQSDIASLLIERGANGFVELNGRKSPVHETTLSGQTRLVERMLETWDHSGIVSFPEITAFSEATCIAFRTPTIDIFPFFWRTCVQLSPEMYFRVVLYVQMMVQCDDPFQNPSETLEDLLQSLLHHARCSDVPKMRSICRLQELFEDRFQYIGLNPDGEISIVNEDLYLDKYDEDYADKQPSLLNYLVSTLSKQRQWLEVFRILLRLGVGTYVTDENDEYMEQSIAATLLLSFSSNIHGASDGPPTSSVIEALIIDGGVDVDITDLKGRTPLMLSAKCNDIDVTKLLIEYGASVVALDKRGKNALAHAVRKDNRGAVTLLTQMGADVNMSTVTGKTPLEHAVTKHLHGMITHLRQIGARRPGSVLDAYGQSIPFLASGLCFRCRACLIGTSPIGQDRESGITVIFDCLASRALDQTKRDNGDGVCESYDDDHNSDDETELQISLINPPLDSVVLNHTFPNTKSWEDGLTPLQAAICLGDTQASRMFLDAQVNVNDVDNQGYTALHYSTYGDGIHVDLLLGHNADPYIQGRNGRTPLHESASGRHFDMVERLLLAMRTRPIDIPDINGDTPLHVAVMAGRRITTQLLVDAGANPFIENNSGVTPVTLALSLGFGTALGDCISVDVFSDARQSLFDEDVIEDSPMEIESLLNNLETTFDGENDCPIVAHSAGSAGVVELIVGLQSIEVAPVVLSPKMFTDTLDPYDEDPVTDVDLYDGYDAEQWTMLGGKSAMPLRPVYFPFTG